MKKILVVDDEIEALRIVERRLKDNNYLVYAASKGKDALAIAKTIKPDLLLLDIAIPDMDGYTIASELRKDKALLNTPIIFITGKELEYKGIEERIAQLAAYDYIAKPCTFEDILAKIKSILV